MTAKVKKKSPRKVRKAIRRTLSGVCMASAIIVACIPAKQTAAYKEPTGVSYSYGVESTDYTPYENVGDKLYSDGVNLKLYSDGSITDSSKGTIYAGNDDVYKILKVSKLSDGTYTVNWQFKIYLQNVSGVAMGVICQYNSTYPEGTVTITPTMPYQYTIISESEYKAFYQSYKNAYDTTSENATLTLKDGSSDTVKARYTSKYSTYVSSYTKMDDEYWLDKYFNVDYTKYLNKFSSYEDYLTKKAEYENYLSLKGLYDQYLIDYDVWVAAGKDPATEPAHVDAPTPVAQPTAVEEPSVTCYVHEMTNDNKLSYFCDVNPDYNTATESLEGYKLVQVADYTKGSSTLDMPNVYMPKGEPNPYFSSSADSADSTNKNDEMGFRIEKKCLVIAIGEDAFRETTNVDQLEMCSEIKYIGDNAFRDSYVKAVTFQNVKNIGNRAFKGCSRLDSLDLKDGAVNIGTEAFYGCKFNALSFPYSIEYIGPGAFANCNKLKSVDFSKMNRDDSIIDNFAFYDDIALSSIDFSDAITKIGDCAFACKKGISGTLYEFTFPDHISDPDGIGNFVLAGRTNLQYVTMPSDYGKTEEVTLPYGTFFNCTSLKCVEFPAVGGASGYVNYGVYGSGDSKRTMFDTVQTSNFYVRGPEKNMAGGIAYPRKSTWGLKTNLGNDVPYIYVDSNGEEQYEISNGKYILIIDDYGVLQSCVLVDNSPATLAEGIDLVIPSQVGNTKVTGIASECFSDDDIHDNLVSVTIEDNSITELADNVFKDCKRLKKVAIGNSVTKIGDSAFEGCSQLTYVSFETPAGGYSAFPMENIGKNAFSTGADSLIFEGDIEEAYGPFAWAMQYDNYVDEENGVRVCYTSGYPTYLTVIVDNRNGYPTLIDYPHYDQIDVLSGTQDDEHPLSERYEKLGETYTVSGNDVFFTMTLSEEKLVNGTMNIDVPNGIKSIDVKGFINNSSEQDSSLTGIHTNTNNVYKYLLSSDYYDQYKKYGLFNGYYGSYTDSEGNKKEMPSNSASEKKAIGNDVITSVNLKSVEYLPDKCFESCENLTAVYLPSQCDDIGKTPFIGCTKLTGLAISSPNYICENGIIYKTLDDGTYELTEVLSSRGSLVGASKVKVGENDPKLSSVSTIADGAFSECDTVYGVDLRGMDLVSSIPDECFKGCDRLSQVVCPENIKAVGHESFADCMEGMSVVFYGHEVSLPSDSFKNMENFSVISYEDSAVRRAAAELGADVSQTLDYSYKVQFFDWDGKELSDIIFVVSGSNVSKDYIPEDPVREGYIFTGWDKSLTNITQDTIVFATYEKAPDDPNKPSPSSGSESDDPSSTSGSGSGSSTSGSSTSTSSSKKTSTSTSSSKKTSSSTSTSTSTSTSNNPADNPSPSNPTTLYTLTVTDGNGSGSYAAGATVIITCTKIPSGKVFSKWVPETNDLGIASVTVSATTMVMPAHNAAVKATFADAGSSSSSSSSSGSSSSTGNKEDSGTKVVISKGGISNTALASAKVTGSPDDYVIRITETQSATEAVEEALVNEYGSLENIKYSAMDISLYDATGSTKITDYDGLSIKITIPIPDVLTQYAGNNKVAGVVDGELDPLNPQFTSIDGVPCITFTAKHFSPYTIYTDVSSISANSGKIDDTPKTGDGIAPKWFLSIGLAALSIALFFMKDKKTRKVKIA